MPEVGPIGVVQAVRGTEALPANQPGLSMIPASHPYGGEVPLARPGRVGHLAPHPRPHWSRPHRCGPRRRATPTCRAASPGHAPRHPRHRLHYPLGVNGFFCALAAHARTHPGTGLVAWWSERRCAEDYGQIVRPDVYGAWVEDGRRVDFFLEHDTGTEPLGRVAAKLSGYADLATAGGPAYPVLLWLPSSAREAHLQRLLGDRAARRCRGHRRPRTRRVGRH
jgi:Replication-relaxation